MHPLRFPDYFPPTDKWKKFFIGVRWLGPDLSFFKDLKAEQAQRSLSDMAAWGGDQRQELAQAISRTLAQQLGWPSEVFLPQDSVAVVFHGPRFDFNDPDSAFEAVVEVLNMDFHISVPDSFWLNKDQVTLGELVDALLAYKSA